MATTTTVGKQYERKRGETKCMLCDYSQRSDRLVAHMLTHKHDLHTLLDSRCRVAAIQHKLPMMFYHNTYVPRKDFKEQKAFCVCLICGKGKYKGGHGSVSDFLRVHRESECMKKWDTVADLFGELPEDYQPTELQSNKQTQQELLMERQINALTETIKNKDADYSSLSRRYNTLYKEHEELRKQLTQRKPVLLETLDPPEEPLTPPLVAPKPTVKIEVIEEKPIENTVAEKDPNENRPGYFLSPTRGKWMRRITKGIPNTGPAPMAAPKPHTSTISLSSLPVGGFGPMVMRNATQVEKKPATGDAMKFLGHLLTTPPESALLQPEESEHDYESEDDDEEYKAKHNKELIDETVFELLDNILNHNWQPDRVSRYIEKFDKENEGVNLNDALMEGDNSAIIRYTYDEDVMEELEELYERLR